MQSKREENCQSMRKRKAIVRQPVRKPTLRTLPPTNMRQDDTKRVALEERARLVLMTLDLQTERTRRTFQRHANQHHPGKTDDNKEKCRLRTEAYALLTRGAIPKRPMLADDDLMARVIGKRVQPLINRQEELEAHMEWYREQFLWGW